MKPLIIDWGIGGLSVYRKIKQLVPKKNFIYISDSGYTAYGKLPAKELKTRLTQVIEYARERWPIDHVIIACNAASTVAPDLKLGVNVTGMIEAGVRVVETCGCTKIGVIGGVRTIESKVYSKRLKAKGFKVTERAAQPLSALIEAGEVSGERIWEALDQILLPLFDVEALLLACTHYPAISKEILKVLPKVRLLDPAAEVASHVLKLIGSDQPADSEGQDEFFTTGDAHQTRISAFKAFQVICDPARIEI